MCRSCWFNDHGAPVFNGPEVLVAAELIRRLYALPTCGSGGPLHWMLDDMNIDDEQFADFDVKVACAARIDALAKGHCAVPPEVAQEIEDTCVLIFHALGAMSEAHRAAAIAWKEGWAQQEIAALARTPDAREASAEQVEDIVSVWRNQIAAPPLPVSKLCVEIPCPPFEPWPSGALPLPDGAVPVLPIPEEWLEGRFSGVAAAPEGARFAPDAKITGPLADYAKVDQNGNLRIDGAPLVGLAPAGSPEFRWATGGSVYSLDGRVETTVHTAEDVLRAMTPPDVSVADVLADPGQIRPIWPSSDGLEG